MRCKRFDLARGLDATTARHPHVHEHDVRHRVLCDVDGLCPVACLTDEIDVLLLLEHHDETATEERVVVDDKHADGLVTYRRRRLCSLKLLVFHSRSSAPP